MRVEEKCIELKLYRHQYQWSLFRTSSANVNFFYVYLIVNEIFLFFDDIQHGNCLTLYINSQL